ncbi:cellular nucleic acid-binding protein homolog [Phtheirospermum japonicum]|uniref:Cellular nucleic acid-binding protein homolog n=1 Tax=Phtheirospermum japonicum TaxID=374723 RepID=A0A830BSX9_9LAMI|nr:cellular nucleic acid-binding protein homolog [Phtheirospermum japonicum]
MKSEQGLTPKVTMINNKEEINDPKNANIGEKTSLPVEAEHVAARVNALLQNLDRASRSNDPPEECSDLECNMYGKNNGKFSNYNARKKKTRCYICGDRDHEGRLCKKVTDCFICSKKGHLVVDCPNKNVEAIECYICRKAGHLCCADDKTILIGASCYNCGRSGHFGWECTKPNGVSYGPGPFCKKCQMRGHHTRLCPHKKQVKSAAEKATERRAKRVTQAIAAADKAAARTAKRKARRARKLNTANTTPIVNPNPNQPNCWSLPPIMGSYHEQPRSTIWIPPPASNGPNPLPNGPGPLPSHHQQHIHYQIGIQVPSSFGPPTQFPHHFYPNFQNRPQITQIPFNQESRNMAPPGTEIRQPVVQPTVPTQFSRVIQHDPRQPLSHQLPWTESRVPPNSTVYPTQFPHVIQNNPRQPFSHHAVIARPSMGSHNPQQYPPRPGWTF